MYKEDASHNNSSNRNSNKYFLNKSNFNFSWNFCGFFFRLCNFKVPNAFAKVFC